MARVEHCPYGCGYRDLPEFVVMHVTEEHMRDRAWGLNEWTEFYKSMIGLDDAEAEQEAEKRLNEQANRGHLRVREPGGL